MARIRTVKPEFPQSESMGRVSRDARLLFILLWTIADDSGRARASSRMLASLLFPYDDDAPRLIDGWLTELTEQHCVVLYTAEGHSYLEIKNWSFHQKIDRPSQSKFPAPPIGKPEDLNGAREPSPQSREPSRGLDEPSSLDQGPRTKEGTKEVPLSNESGAQPKVAGSKQATTKPPEPPKPVAVAQSEQSAKAKPAPSTPTPPPPAPAAGEVPKDPNDPWVEVFARGKQVLGRNAGGLITNLKLLYDGKHRKVLAKIEDAAEQREPREWMVAFLLKADDGGRLSGQHIG